MKGLLKTSPPWHAPSSQQLFSPLVTDYAQMASKAWNVIHELALRIQLSEHCEDVIPAVWIRKGEQALILHVLVRKSGHMNSGIVLYIDVVLRRIRFEVFGALKLLQRALVQPTVLGTPWFSTERTVPILAFGQHSVQHKARLILLNELSGFHSSLCFAGRIHIQPPLDALVWRRRPGDSHSFLIPQLSVDTKLFVGLRTRSSG
jgi:hypothetical protein